MAPTVGEAASTSAAPMSSAHVSCSAQAGDKSNHNEAEPG